MSNFDIRGSPGTLAAERHELKILKISYIQYCGERKERASSAMKFTNEQTRIRDISLQLVAVFPYDFSPLL